MPSALTYARVLMEKVYQYALENPHELGVDINRVLGTGIAGRISDEDVKAHAKTVIQGGQSSSLSNLQTTYVEVPDFSEWGLITTEPMSRIRQITAESTVNSWQSIPQVVQLLL